MEEVSTKDSVRKGRADCSFSQKVSHCLGFLRGTQTIVMSRCEDSAILNLFLMAKMRQLSSLPDLRDVKASTTLRESVKMEEERICWEVIISMQNRMARASPVKIEAYEVILYIL